MNKTWPEVLAFAMTFVETPTPYEWGGEGSKPGEGTDCSRFVQVVEDYAGNPFERTTEDQYGDTCYPHRLKTATPQPGWLCYLQIVGDVGNPPQHVGLCISSTEYINAPHTGEDVMVAPIPKSSAESRMEFVAPPYAAVESAPPVPIPNLEEETMFSYQRSDGKTVIVGKDVASGNTKVITSDTDTKVEGGWGEVDVTAAIEAAYPGTVVKLD